jgi:hypothetical protein
MESGAATRASGIMRKIVMGNPSLGKWVSWF